MMFCRGGIVLTFLLLGLMQSFAVIPLENFFPYGPQNGDNALAREDDAFSTINIAFKFPFFGRIYNEVHISTNGIITFGAGSNSYQPKKFPLQDFRSIATYWSDSDPRNGGEIYYREVNSTELLSRITKEIRLRFIEYKSFTSTWALIVTFDKVAQFGCGEFSLCSKPCSAILNYQTILTSNGINSFTIFLYNKLDFTSGKADCAAHAQIGFNAGDGKRFYIVPSSNTPNIGSVALTTSNVGVPGQWMFSIDGSDIEEGCNAHGKLEIFPRKMLYFGREDIIIAGPCFNEIKGNITVVFDGRIEVECKFTETFQLRCPAPYFLRIGLTSVSLIYRNVNYTTFIMIVDISDLLVIHSESLTIHVPNLDSSFEITWNTSLFGSSDNLIVIRGFQIDSILKIDGDFEYDIVTSLQIITSNNTGNNRIYPIRSDISLKFVRRILLVLCDSSNRNHQIVRIITLMQTVTCEQQCLAWYKKQPSSMEMRNIVNRASQRDPCPPVVPRTNFLQRIGKFQLDSNCNPLNFLGCEVFHPGARACYKTVNNGGNPAVQCCYNSAGRLMLGPPGGGRLDFKDSSDSLLDHLRGEVLPYIACCKCSKLCSLYYEKRPSIDSRRFQPPRGSNGGGDPHFTTVDGSQYTFNPVGEFIYLVTDDSDVIQVRISQYVDDNGVTKDASYFSAFVVKSASSSIVQVELNDQKLFRFRINGESMILDFGVWNFNEISVDYVNSTFVQIHTSSSLGAEFHIHSGILNVILAIPQSLKGKIHGLVGNWDDVPNNDLETPDGTVVPLNSSAEEIHNSFGMSWKTNQSTSLFTYPTGLSWDDYQNYSFKPNYDAAPTNDACQGNSQCNYDAHVTGNVNVGLANLVRDAYAAEIAADNQLISSYCPASVEVNNGVVATTEESVSRITYRITCNKGFKLYGESTVVCSNGQYGELPTCENPSAASLTRSGCLSFGLIVVLTLLGLN